MIWSRYATQITPINYNLMIVNIFMGLSAGYQLYRKTYFQNNYLNIFIDKFQLREEDFGVKRWFQLLNDINDMLCFNKFNK